LLAQFLSARYQPPARSDFRTISTPGEEGGWDWHDYRRRWDAAQALGQLRLAVDDIKRHFERLDSALFFSDPLYNWSDLLPFVKREQRAKLKYDALRCQTLITMRDMIGLFYRDLTGENLLPRQGALREQYELNESVGQLLRTPEERATRVDHDVQLLEFVTARYGLNPRASLILFVEGDGEEVVIPKLADRLFAARLPVYGIEVRNLHGLPGYLGRKREARDGALEKAIEELHVTQTVAFLVLDTDNITRARNIRERLADARSKYVPARTITRRELIHLWEKSIEFDNFSSEEIAAALTATAEGRHVFTPMEVEHADMEVEHAEQDFAQKGDPLSRLYKRETDYSLPKPQFLERLFAVIEPDESPMRPIVALLDQILWIAALNHRPAFIDTWIHNQEIGLLGRPLDGRQASAEVKARLEKIRILQEHLPSDDD